MGKYLKLFETDSDRIEYEGSENYLEPYVSYVEGDNSVHYNKPKFFCKLTLNDGSTVELEGSGELTSQMTSQYQSNLVKAEIGKLCTSIEGGFVNCRSLTSVIIPLSVTTIGGNAFRWCYGLTSVVIPNSVTSIGNSAFYECTGLTSVTIPNSVASIGEWVFSGCKGLTEIIIPDSVTSIGNSAFYACTGLTSVTIGNSVTSIGNSAFSICSGLTSVTIGNSVTNIEQLAFSNCKGLTEVIIPNSVTSIGRFAFYGCSSLTSITVLATTPPSLTENEFNETNNAPIYVPSESVDAYKAASGWSGYAFRIQAIPTE